MNRRNATERYNTKWPQNHNPLLGDEDIHCKKAIIPVAINGTHSICGQWSVGGQLSNCLVFLIRYRIMIVKGHVIDYCELRSSQPEASLL